MSHFSKCMSIISEMPQHDQDALLERLDFHIAQGVPPNKAQRLAAVDLLESIEAEAEQARLNGFAKTLTVEAVQQVVDGMKSKWINAPAIVVAADLQDAIVPQAVRDASERQASNGSMGEPEGVFHGGVVYLFSDQMRSQGDVARVVLHEVLGHAGLRGAFGDALDGVLAKVAESHADQVAAKDEEYGLDLDVESDRLEAAEEVLAELAQTSPELGIVRNAIAAIRTWLRENMPSLDRLALTDDEVTRSYLIPARNWVERGRTAAQSSGGSRYKLGAVSPAKTIPGLKDQVAQLNWRAKPGASTGLLPNMAQDMSSDDQRDYATSIRNALASVGPNAQTMLGWGKRYTEALAGRADNGVTGWGYAGELKLSKGEVDARTRNEIEFFLALNGMLTGQDGMAWHKPTFGKQGQGLEINLGGRRLDDKQFEELYAAIQHEFRNPAIQPVTSKDGVRFLNLEGMDQAEFKGKIKKAINETSIYDIWENANTRATGSAPASMAETTGSPLRPGPSDLQRGRDDDNAFSPEGIRAFDVDGGRITNDWAKGETQFKERLVTAWRALKDLPGHSLPGTLEALDAYLSATQDRVNSVSQRFADSYNLGKAHLTQQERVNGLTISYGYPARRGQSERAKGAYFKDADGNALTMYHGTGYDMERIEGRDGIVFYATTALSYADMVAGVADGEESPNIIPVRILSNNPFDWRIQAHREKVMPLVGELPKGYPKNRMIDGSSKSISFKMFPDELRKGNHDLLESAEFAQAAKAAGFDAVLVRDAARATGHINVGVFNPGDVVFGTATRFSRRSNSAGLHSVTRATNSAGLHSAQQAINSAASYFATQSANSAGLHSVLPTDSGARVRSVAWSMYAPTKFDDLVYKLQDKLIDTKRVIESIKKYGGKVAENLNIYLQEELFHGRVAKRTSDFAELELMPMMEEIRKYGYKLEDVEEYLHARHAPEANAVIAQRNPDEPGLQDGGSGMTDQASQDYFNNLPPTDAKHLASIAKQVDAILDKTRQMYVDYGLEDRETIEGWEDLAIYYVPLQREGKGSTIGAAQGFSVKGKMTRGRTGSNRKVVDIMANIALQREQLISKGEKNRVAMALLGLARANPNPEFWQVLGQAPTERVYDQATDTVVDRSDPMFKQRDHVLTAKVRDARGKVTEQMVVFNEDDPRALRMAKSLKNIDVAQLEGVLGVSAKITRYFSAINTQYNPVFGVVNLVRDVQGAVLNLDATPLADKKTRIARDTASALRGIYADMRAMRKGHPAHSKWADLWEEFQLLGGQTGYRQMFATSEDRANELRTTLNPDAWMEGKHGKLTAPLSKAKEGLSAVFGWLSDYNESMENAVRLSAYKAGIDQGMTKEAAASLAKNLTVNFNRKGQAGQQVGALYAFFNASMQGTARIGQTLFSMEGGDYKTLKLNATGKKIVYGGMLLGVMQALALAAAGFGDDDPPEFVRERSLIIPTGGKTYIAIPMPLGFNVIPGLGRHIAEFALSGFEKPGKRVASVLGMFAGSFNPIGGSGLSLQTIAPTVIDPFAALAENKDWTGKPIARTSSNKAMPGHLQHSDGATAVGKFLAEGINWATGGDAYSVGALSPTPDQIDYLLAQVTGGVGREVSKTVQSAAGTIRGEDVPIYKVPLLGRFYGDADSHGAQVGQFYANVDRLNEIETTAKLMRSDGQAAQAKAFLKERPEAYYIAMGNVAERQVQKLRREKRALIDKEASREAIQRKDAQIVAVMGRLNRSMDRLKGR